MEFGENLKKFIDNWKRKIVKNSQLLTSAMSMYTYVLLICDLSKLIVSSAIFTYTSYLLDI